MKKNVRQWYVCKWKKLMLISIKYLCCVKLGIGTMWLIAFNYSLFHAVSALLVNDGYMVNFHRGAVGAFGQHYVTTGIFLLTMENIILVYKDYVRNPIITVLIMQQKKK